MGYIKGVLYCLLWYSSILAGYAALYCPLFPLLLVSNKLYRYCTDHLFAFWQMYPTALLEKCIGCEIQVLGDAIETNETSLLVMNHRTRTDWNFLWPALYHCSRGDNRFGYPTKFVLKDMIRHIPGPGWVMQLSCFVYIKRQWLYDQKKLQHLVEYFCQLSYKFSLLVFPEGTDLTPTTRQISDKFAEKNNLQKYNCVLHPRTTGFTFLAHQLLKKNALDALYDITLVYPDLVPQTEKFILSGNFPKQIKIHFTRYTSKILPRSEESLKRFLENRWLEKEKVLKEFHSTGHFLHGKLLKSTKNVDLYLALVFWTALPLVVILLLITQTWFVHIVLAHTLLLLLINLICGGGFQDLEIFLYNFKRKFVKEPF